MVSQALQCKKTTYSDLTLKQSSHDRKNNWAKTS